MATSWLKKIIETVGSMFTLTRPPARDIPPVLLLCEVKNRSGLSAMALTSNIISRLPEIGFDTGPNPDGSVNIVNHFVRILSEEWVREYKEHGVIFSIIPKGTINITGEGVNAGGPVTITATNLLDILIKGIPQ